MTFLQKGSGVLSDEMLMAMVCEKMHWTYQQFLAQPTWFVKLLLLKFSTDAQYQSKLTKKYGKGSNT